MMCYPGTQLLVLLLFGMEIPDPKSSGLMVPLLGMECDGNATDVIPCGSMEDANSKDRRKLGASESPRNVT